MADELLLPSEVINTANYPGLYNYQAQIQDVASFSTTIADALDNYTTGVTDTIVADPGQVSLYITKMRSLCAALAALSPVPFAVLYSIRDMQVQLQTVLFATNAASTNGGASAWQPAQS